MNRLFFVDICWDKPENNHFKALVFFNYPTKDEIEKAMEKAYPDWRQRATSWHLRGVYSEPYSENYLCPADKLT